MPRARTGTIERHGDHADARLTLADGSRPRVCLPPGLSEARARDRARRLAEVARTENATMQPASEPEAPTGDPLRAYADHWCASRDERGLASVDDDRGRLPKWVLQMLGEMAITAVGRSDLERFADDATRKKLTFHDRRATGITWMALRGDEPIKIMRRAAKRTSRRPWATSGRPRT